MKLVEENKQDEEEHLPIKDKRLAKLLKTRKPNIAKNFKLVYGLKGINPMPEKFICKFLKQN